MHKKFLRCIAILSVHHTGKMLIGIMILTLIFGVKASSLQLQISFDSLLSNNNPRIETFNQILDEFENDANILLLAVGTEDSLRSFAYRIKPLLESFDKWVSGVHIQAPIEFLRKNVLKIMNPDELENFGGVYSNPNLVPFLINLNNAFENRYLHSNNGIKSQRDEQDAIDFLDRLQMFIMVQNEIMQETEALDVGQKAVDAIIFEKGLKLSLNRNMLLIIIEPGFNLHLSAEKLMINVNGIEEIIDKTASQHGIKAGLAGPLVIARDHYSAFLSGFWRISMLSLAGFFFILILFFRMWSVPLICISTLIVSVVWTLGIYSFFIKAINLISILALIIVILLGLGNCILLISGFIEKRIEGLNEEVSIKETLHHLGSVVIVSGGVVGLTFLSLILSEIKVWQDLGIMVGVGITTTVLVSVIFLPSLLIIKEKLHGNVNPLFPSQDISYPTFGKAVQWIAKYRWISIIFILLITGVLLHQGMQMHINTNLSNLASHDLDNMNVENELIQAFGISSNLISFITDNLETARTLTDQARKIMYSGLVESISDYLPDEEFNNKKFRYLRELRRNIKSCEVRRKLSSHDMNMYRNEIERLEANIIELQDFSLLDDQFKVYEKTIQLVGDGTDSSFQGILSPFINALDTGMNRLKLTYFQEQFSSAFKSTILEMANMEPLTLLNLPSEIKDRFTGENSNIFRINIYPHQNILDDTIFLNRFVNELSTLSQKITGWPVLFVELKDRLSYYGFQAIRLILFSMLFLLLISLRSIKYALIIIVSIISVFIWLLGSLFVLNSPLNLINVWIIPVILSIAMNHAIQILLRWKQEKNLDTVYRSTGNAILLTTITIVVLVFPFCFANHIGLTSIASVLLAGLGFSFLVHLIVLPPLLAEEFPGNV